MGAPPNIKMRGLSKDREVSTDDLYRDLRTPMEKIGDLFADSIGPAIALTLFLLPVALISTTTFVLVCVPILLWAYGRVEGKDQSLPLLLPSEAGITDYRDAKPGRIGYFKARGEFMLGNQRAGKKKYELWLSFTHLLTHQMLLGATGSGKTEALVSKVANYLSVGSGIMYSDAKAAPKLGWQIFTLARYFGREDDFRALNYIKGNTSLKPDRAVRRGNNVNLFAYGSSESITQILVSLMPPGGSENKLFSERAISLISSIMPAMVDLRDKANLKINPGVIRKALEFDEIEKLKRAKPISPESREAIRAYLTSLSGYRENPTDRQGNPTDKQDAEVYRQHGFAQAYYTRALASLSDTYADIYMVGRGEINFLDLIMRRRICTVLIPALEKAPEEMKNLAKIVLAAQKNAISTGIPPDIEGRKEDVLDSLPTTAPVPFGIINDEFAFMMTPGYGTVLAQARGLYSAVTIAGQDYAGMKREDPDEAEQIAENTKVKIVMASEGLGATKELIEQVAGEGYTSLASGFSVDDGSMTHMYRDGRQANFERRSRVDVQDTRSVVEGEGIVFWRDNVVPMTMFYHGVDEKSMIKDFTIHRLLDVDYPTRGPGAKLLLKDTPMAESIKKAVREGLDLGVSTNDIPPFSQTDSALGEMALDVSLRNWRKVTKLVRQWSKEACSQAGLPGQRQVASEGLLIGLLSSQGGVEAPMDTDEQDFVDTDRTPPANHPLNRVDEVASVASTVNTLQAPASDGSDLASEIEAASLSLNDPDNALAMLSEPRRTAAPADPSEAAATAASEDDDIQPPSGERFVTPDSRKKAAEQAKAALKTRADRESASRNTSDDVPAATPALVSSASEDDPLIGGMDWVLDPNRLADRVNRPIHKEEIDFAVRSSSHAARLERALGSSEEDTRKVMREAAVAITRSLTYPIDESHTPAAPQNDVERKLVIRDSSRTIARLKEWASDENNANG